MLIGLLLGGETGERSVSLVSGQAVGAACLRLGHEVLFLDPATGLSDRRTPANGCDDIAERFASATPHPDALLPSLITLVEARVDVVAVILHGGFGEGGGLQRVLELLRLPFTGSNGVSSTLAMDKDVARRLMEREGVPVARGATWPCSRSGPITPPAPSLVAELGGYPIVAKPIAGGSTVGVTIVEREADWTRARDAAGEELDPVRGLLLESFVPGRELTVGILDGAALPVVEIVPKEGFYDFRRKYTAGESEYKVPAPLDDELARSLQHWAEVAFRALGCRDLGRVDFRWNPAGEVACLEVNTVPGMTPTSLLPKAARATGIEFDELVARLLESARRRGAGAT